jgi:hypothetical protein
VRLADPEPTVEIDAGLADLRRTTAQPGPQGRRLPWLGQVLCALDEDGERLGLGRLVRVRPVRREPGLREARRRYALREEPN